MIMSVLCNKSPAVIHGKLKGHNCTSSVTINGTIYETDLHPN